MILSTLGLLGVLPAKWYALTVVWLPLPLAGASYSGIYALNSKLYPTDSPSNVYSGYNEINIL